MPPPKRQRGEKPAPRPVETRRGLRKGMSIYLPPALAAPLGGFKSTNLGQAVMCWSHLLEEASVRVGQEVSPPEWRLLALALEHREASSFDPGYSKPGDQLAEAVERASNLGHAVALGKGGEARARALADRLRGMDYVTAWAVIWALQWRSAQKVPPEQEGWWLLSHRQQHAGKAAEEEQDEE